MVLGDILFAPVPITLGQRVRAQRIFLRWRQVDLAEEADVPPACVSRLERDLPIYPAAKSRILQTLELTDG